VITVGSHAGIECNHAIETCFNCGKPRHIAIHFPEPNKRLKRNIKRPLIDERSISQPQLEDRLGYEQRFCGED